MNDEEDAVTGRHGDAVKSRISASPRHPVSASFVHPSSFIPKIPVDAHVLVIYHLLNTGKEVIQKYMSSNHSEVAAA